ncbi:MAG: hypothetical protein PQJ46_17295, partial [Spirochaetales bacterium]|nr:hypothetical protein [Spirochaetales bacterium]
VIAYTTSEKSYTVEDSDSLSAGTYYCHCCAKNDGEYGSYGESALFTISELGSDSPNPIKSAEELVYISDNFTSNADFRSYDYILENDIDMDGVSFSSLGDQNYKYTGTFDGNEKEISNLTIGTSTTTEAYQGFFANADGAVIKNLTLNNVDIHGGDKVGGLLGKGSNCHISGCTVLGEVSGGDFVGGLAGYLGSKKSGYDETVINCSSKCIVTGTSDVGGLVGKVESVVFDSCYSETALVKGSTIGGFIGRDDTSSTVSNCYSISKLSETTGTYAGGFLGISTSSSSYSNCYAVTEDSDSSATIMGFIGANTSSASFSDCYYDGTLCADGDAASSGVAALSTSQMKDSSNYSGWTFSDDYWSIDNSETTNNGYPYLSLNQP